MVAPSTQVMQIIWGIVHGLVQEYRTFISILFGVIMAGGVIGRLNLL